MPAPRRAPAIAALVIANLLWAGNFVVGAAVVHEIDPLSLVFLRWSIAAVLLVILAVAIERPSWRPIVRALPLLAALAVLGMLGYVTALYEALRFTSATEASLINALNPALITLGSALILRERLSARVIIGMLLGLVGVLVVLTQGSFAALIALKFSLGDLLMIVAIVTWTVYTLLGRRLRDIPPVTATASQAVIAAVVMVPVVAIAGLHLPNSGAGWSGLGYIALFPSVAAYLLWNSALRRIRPAVAGVFLNLLTVFAVVIEVALGRALQPAEVIGGVLVLGGVALASVPRRAQPEIGAGPRSS